MLRWIFFFQIFLFSLKLHFADAKCECGYLISRGNQPAAHFTDSIITDFTDPNMDKVSPDWIPSRYGIPAYKGAKNQYYYPSNVIKPKGQRWLELRTQRYSGHGPVRGGEISTARTDILHGSFRANLKTSTTPGVCQAFFFYRDDSQEIDIEILSAHRTYAHFTDQPNLTTKKLSTFDPAKEFHHYRFDWLPNVADMWLDGKLSVTHKKEIARKPGAIFLNSWSNGDGDWSGGPPKKDAIFQIGKVELYFNSTSAKRNEAWKKKCTAAKKKGKAAADASVCHIKEM